MNRTKMIYTITTMHKITRLITKQCKRTFVAISKLISFAGFKLVVGKQVYSKWHYLEQAGERVDHVFCRLPDDAFKAVEVCRAAVHW